MTKILVIDDEVDLTTTIKKGLEKKGLTVDTYNDPQEALENFIPNEYDLLLLDIRMPKINGFEVYRELKKKDKKIRVCFFTAFEVYYDEFKKLFPDLQIQCFIRKPITINELEKHIKYELSK